MRLVRVRLVDVLVLALEAAGESAVVGGATGTELVIVVERSEPPQPTTAALPSTAKTGTARRHPLRPTDGHASGPLRHRFRVRVSGPGPRGHEPRHPRGDRRPRTARHRPRRSARRTRRSRTPSRWRRAMP